MQKEIVQRLDEINDIASHTNFNGKYLLNGNFDVVKKISVSNDLGQTSNRLTNTKNITVRPPSYTAVYNANGTIDYIQNNMYDIASDFTAFSSGTGKGDNLWSGRNISCDYGFSGSDSNWASDIKTNLSLTVDYFNDNEMAVNMNFNLDNIEQAADLHNEGFSILCGGCDQYVNISFDSDLSNSQSTYGRSISNGANVEYKIGISDLSAVDINTLSEAVFNGVIAAHDNSNDNYGINDDIKSGDEEDATVLRTSLDERHHLGIALNPYYYTDETAADPSDGECATGSQR